MATSRPDKNTGNDRNELTQIRERLIALEEEGQLQKQIDKLQVSNENITGKLNKLEGITAVIGLVFAVLSGLAGYKIYQYDLVQTSHEPLIQLFENEIGGTIDRVSFLDPIDKQQTYRIEKLKGMRVQLESLGLKDEKFMFRAGLVDAIAAVIANDTQKANAKLVELAQQSTGKDSFIEARAYTLRAINLIRDTPGRTCANPEVRTLAADAIKIDSQVASAYNILGLCFTNDAISKVESTLEADLIESGSHMQKAIQYYDFSYSLNPTNWGRSKSLNNKVWGSSTFFLNALGNDVLVNRFLTISNYRNMEEFLAASINQMEFCKELSPNHSAWWETQAEVLGLQYTYLMKIDKKKEAEETAKLEKEQYREAIRKGLFKNVPLNKAMKGFTSDKLLSEKLRGDEEIIKFIREASVSDEQAKLGE
jgi:tetratricopeptide (TPR) repeat protein